MFLVLSQWGIDYDRFLLIYSSLLHFLKSFTGSPFAASIPLPSLHKLQNTSPTAMAEHGQAANVPIEADPELLDSSDSTLGDDTASSKYTASLTSSIERYPVENGRRYHAFKDGSYVMPNDESELDRLDLTHNMLKIAMGMKLFNAPIGNAPKRILDVGTGELKL